MMNHSLPIKHHELRSMAARRCPGCVRPLRPLRIQAKRAVDPGAFPSGEVFVAKMLQMINKIIWLDDGPKGKWSKKRYMPDYFQENPG